TGDLRQVAHGVGDRRGGSNIETGESESIEIQLSYDRLEVPDPAGEAWICDAPVRIAHSAHVVPEDPPSELHQTISDLPEVRPARGVAGQVAEDVCRDHQGWAVTEARVRDADAITGRGVLDRQGRLHAQGILAAPETPTQR